MCSRDSCTAKTRIDVVDRSFTTKSLTFAAKWRDQRSRNLTQNSHSNCPYTTSTSARNPTTRDSTKSDTQSCSSGHNKSQFSFFLPYNTSSILLSNSYNRLADVAGTQEPIYGPTAIQSVSKQAETTPYTELTRNDLKWQTVDQTSVETQIFYITADSGHFALAQVIYSNVA